MIKIGDKVRIVGSAEEEKYKDCVFEVLSEPYNICGSMVVKMKCNETGKIFRRWLCSRVFEKGR